MYCHKCGTQLPENSRFCNLCATQLGEQFKARESLQQKPASNGKLLLGSVAVVAMLALVIYAVNNSARSSNPPAQSPNATQQPVAPTPQPAASQPSAVQFTAPQYVDRADEIASGSFTVEPRQWRYFKFTVHDGMKQPRVVGRFSASGGGGNDIEALITNADGYTNFANGHSASVWYQSGKVTVDNISTAPLPPGEFYLVFNNRYSLITNKAVTAQIKLAYQALK